MATYGSADNVHIVNRGSGVVGGQPVTYGIAQPQQYSTTQYTSYNTGEVNPAYHTTYTGYSGTAADHAHTNAPPKITFGGSNTQGSINNNYRVSAPPPVTTTTSVVNPVHTVNPVPPTRVIEEPRVTTSAVHPVQSSVVNTTYQQPVAQPVTTTHTYQQPMTAAQPLQTTYHHQPVRTEAKEDNFLCSRCCWIIAAIIGLILLTLALLWGLGVFGGEGKPSGKAPYWGTDATVAAPAVAGPAVAAPTVTAPTVVAPTATAPHVTAPTVVAPTVAAPTVAQPTVVQPSYVAPTVHQPTVAASQPVVQQPHYVAPTVQQPTVATSQPVVQQPHYVAPSVQPGAVTTQPVVATQPTYVAPSTQPVVTQPTVVNPQVVPTLRTSNNPYSHQAAHLVHEKE